METCDCEMVICLSEVFDHESFLLCSLVLQLISHMLPRYLLRGLPLDQSSVSYGGADHHSGLARH